ncbi:RnfABCDGE type electron transport complex subunit D, partial [Thermodesulfobacteriota bacterium]
VIGKVIFGGIGCNPFNPVLVAIAVLTLSWKGLFNFDQALVNFNLDFNMVYPLGLMKQAIGVDTIAVADAVSDFSIGGLLIAQQSGGIGSTFGLGLIAGGLYLILRGHIRWEISVSFLVGIFITALLFNIADSEKYAGPVFHLLTGYTLIGAFFLAPEDSSSPANFVPMIIYGLLAGILAILIRNIGAFVDGVVLAILMLNVANPLIDKIRPKAIGKGI